jgi:glycosyltransferase involved in cell wall biosynthesis
MKTKICHVFSEVLNPQLAEVLVKAMDEKRFEVCFVSLENAETLFHKKLEERGYEVYFIEFKTRKDILKAIWNTRKLFQKIRPEIVHGHLVNGSLVGLIAAKLSGIHRRAVFRHHSIENHVYYPHGVYYDKIINSLAKRIAANTQMTANVMIEKEHVAPEKITVMNLRFPMSNLNPTDESVRNLKRKYNLLENQPIVGVISRFVEWKGIQFIIPAFKRLLSEFPQAKLVMANAVGSYTPEIKKLLDENLTKNQYELIEFESEVYALYKTFDVFAHVPINEYAEAFGQVYVEALALDVPSVFTLSGIASEFIQDRENALVVPYCDSDSIYRAMKTILTDVNLRDKMVAKGKADVRERFDVEGFGMELEKFYSEI